MESDFLDYRFMRIVSTWRGCAPPLAPCCLRPTRIQLELQGIQTDTDGYFNSSSRNQRGIRAFGAREPQVNFKGTREALGASRPANVSELQGLKASVRRPLWAADGSSR